MEKQVEYVVGEEQSKPIVVVVDGMDLILPITEYEQMELPIDVGSEVADWESMYKQAFEELEKVKAECERWRDGYYEETSEKVKYRSAFRALLDEVKESEHEAGKRMAKYSRGSGE